VTVCGTFQSAVVKTSCALSGVPSVGTVDVTGTVTVASGWLWSTTVNVICPPCSVVLVVGRGADTTRFAVSSSRLVSATSAGLIAP
jgi:hypothetical protein